MRASILFLLLFFCGFTSTATGNTHALLSSGISSVEKENATQQLISESTLPFEACLNFGKEESSRSLSRGPIIFTPAFSACHKPLPAEFHSYSKTSFYYSPAARLHLFFCVLLC